MPSNFYFYQFKTPIGSLRLTATSKGLYALDFGRKGAHFAPPSKAPAFLKQAAQEILDYLKGRRVNFEKFNVDWSGCRPLDKNVLQILRRVPAGRTVSYQSLAVKAGRPKAARAVGRIMNRNRLPLIIPCHRVLPKTGGFGGFSKGVPLKRRLLKLEGAVVDKKPGP